MTGRQESVAYHAVRVAAEENRDDLSGNRNPLQPVDLDVARPSGGLTRPEQSLSSGDRAAMFRNPEVGSDFKLIEVRQHGDRYRIVLDTDHVAVKDILRFFSFASQFANTFFYKSKAVAVSEEKEQDRGERQARYEKWCIGTALPRFRSLQGTPTEKFRQMKEWLNAQGETLEFMGGRENGNLRAEVESLIYNTRKFKRAANKNVNTNLEIPSDIIVMRDVAGGDVS